MRRVAMPVLAWILSADHPGYSDASLLVREFRFRECGTNGCHKSLHPVFSPMYLKRTRDAIFYPAVTRSPSSDIKSSIVLEFAI